jgi:cation transport regulator ChaC
MALVFQYGSNASLLRLNSENRLNGAAKKIGIAITLDKFDFGFTVWSKRNRCAVADIIPNGEKNIWGVLYEIPDERIFRSLRKGKEKCLDQIEGEGYNYKRIKIKVSDIDGKYIHDEVHTYVAIDIKREDGLKTNQEYVTHIINGLNDNKIPKDYIDYVINEIKKNNSKISQKDEL